MSLPKTVTDGPHDAGPIEEASAPATGPAAVRHLDATSRRLPRARSPGGNAPSAPPPPASSPADSIVGLSEWARRLRRTAQRAADVECTVFLVGECGTGKALVARTIHASGPRAGKPFVRIDCRATSAKPLSEQLFGTPREHNGPTTNPGCFCLAEGGLVFLDEIGEMSLDLQAKLLRVLQRREVIPAGAENPVPIDVQVVAATSRNLEDEVSKGTFREDLYFRLSMCELQMLPLRERREDIPLLAASYLGDRAARAELPIRVLSAAAIAALQSYDWPNNVDELHLKLRRASLGSSGRKIEPEDLALTGAAPAPPVVAPDPSDSQNGDIEYLPIRARLEKFLVDFVVEQTGYPEELVELDADLEGDLGIDSIRKAQLFGEISEQYDLGPHASESPELFPTLRHLLDYMLSKIGGRVPTARADRQPGIDVGAKYIPRDAATVAASSDAVLIGTAPDTSRDSKGALADSDFRVLTMSELRGIIHECIAAALAEQRMKRKKKGSKHVPRSSNLGRRIDELVSRKGMTLTALAAASDLSLNALGNLRRGDTLPRLSSLQRVAAALGVEVASLLVEESPTSENHQQADAERVSSSTGTTHAGRDVPPERTMVGRRRSVSPSPSSENPWATAAERFPVVGSTIRGTVTRITDFGAFVRLEAGVVGLVPISELAHRRVHSVWEVVNEGETVECLVLSSDAKQRHLLLSIKALAAIEPPVTAEADRLEAEEAARPQMDRQKREKPHEPRIDVHAESAVYEGHFLLDQSKCSCDPSVAVKQVDDLIAASGGTVLASWLWNVGNDHPINGHDKRVHCLTYFRMLSAQVPTLEHRAERNDLIIRNSITPVFGPLPVALIEGQGGDALRKGLRAGEGGLAKISDEAVEALANFRGPLDLSSFTTLSVLAAEALAKHKGGLFLNGLTTLSDDAAEALAKHKHILSLNGLTTLSDDAAEALAKHGGTLSLNGLTTLSDAAVESLAKHKGWRLSLNGLTTLSDDAAEALAKHNGWLSLNGLTTLSDDAAEALAKHKGWRLSLKGLINLSDGAAETLQAVTLEVGWSKPEARFTAPDAQVDLRDPARE